MDVLHATPVSAYPLRRSNVDTDQIIPAVYLKRVTRTGFEDGLFAAWRNDPDFVLNRPEYAAGTVLVAGPDFGTGSSREHAVWALHGLRLPGRAVAALRRHLPRQLRQGRPGRRSRSTRRSSSDSGTSSTTTPAALITVDLESRTVKAGAGVDAIEDSFDIDDYTRWRLLEGLDDVGITLGHEDAIEAFESKRASFKPRTIHA